MISSSEDASVIVSIQGNSGHLCSVANVVVGATAATLQTGAAISAIATQLGVAFDSTALVRTPAVETEVTYTLPAGIASPEDLSLMAHLDGTPDR